MPTTLKFIVINSLVLTSLYGQSARVDVSEKAELVIESMEACVKRNFKNGSISKEDYQNCKASSPLSPEEITNEIKKNMDQVLSCYEKELALSPDLAGKMKIQFFINGDGSVRDAHALENSTESELLANCVSSRIRNWHFPTPKEGRTLSAQYPFIFDQRAIPDKSGSLAHKTLDSLCMILRKHTWNRVPFR